MFPENNRARSGEVWGQVETHSIRGNVILPAEHAWMRQIRREAQRPMTGTAVAY